eukprot:TRINITY_DN9023_c0_g1_i1.p1 TRINITY_DN9023_c0_g1~~TRINITY_DN9023_c0_g1_i1.p1  ORF type:complete len:959 (+),score=192.39 TRINITY_DN9023_c0_g1_i1:1471-4347(+)
MYRCRVLLHRLEKAATELFDEQQRILADASSAGDKLRTDLVDSLRIAESSENWKEEWEQDEQQRVDSKIQGHKRMREGATHGAARRDNARDREEQMYRDGQLPSNHLPPHPRDFDEIVRRVRYAHLMPIPELPKSIGSRLFIAECFPILTSTVDNLLSLPGVTLDQLVLLPVEQHDQLIQENFITIDRQGALAADEAVLHITSSGVDSGTQVDAVTADEGARDQAPPSEEVTVRERTKSVDEVFAGQAAMMQGADEAMDMRDEAHQSAVARTPQRKRQKALTASQALQAVALLCDLPVEEALPAVLSAVGETKDVTYVTYYWNVARNIITDKASLPWDAYIEALALCKTNEVETAYNTVEEMKDNGITPSIEVWNAMMLCYMNNYDSESALKVAENIRMFSTVNPNHNTFLYTIRAHRDDFTVDTFANASRAMNVMYEMTNVYRLEPTRLHYEALLQVLQYPAAANSDWYLEVQTQAKQMKHLGIPWSPVIYEVLMWIEGCKGDIDKVRELFLTYRKRKLPPTDRTYAGIIQAYACAIPVDGILDPNHFEWTRQRRDEWEQEHDSPLPLDHWRRRLYKEGNAIFNLAKKHDGILKRTVYSYLLMVSSLNPEDLREAWETEGKPYVSTYPRIYTPYIEGLLILAAKGDVTALDEAEEAFVKATKEGLRQHRRIYIKLMEAHIKTGREGSVDIALDYMHAMERSGQSMTSGAVKRIKMLVDAMGPKRDAVRRAKSLMERRAQLSNDLFPTDAPVLNAAGAPVQMSGLTPDGFIFPNTPSGVNPDGTLAGETFEERKAALAQLGYQPMNIENTADIRATDKTGDWMAYAARNPKVNFVPDHPSFDKVLANKHVQDEPEEVSDPFAGASTLLSMESSQKVEDLYNVEKPYFSKSFAHTADHPSAWTPDQQKFMQSWLRTSAGQTHNAAADEREEVQRVLRSIRGSRAKETYPDEHDYDTDTK